MNLLGHVSEWFSMTTQWYHNFLNKIITNGDKFHQMRFTNNIWTGSCFRGARKLMLFIHETIPCKKNGTQNSDHRDISFRGALSGLIRDQCWFKMHLKTSLSHYSQRTQACCWVHMYISFRVNQRWVPGQNRWALTSSPLSGLLSRNVQSFSTQWYAISCACSRIQYPEPRLLREQIVETHPIPAMTLAGGTTSVIFLLLECSSSAKCTRKWIISLQRKSFFHTVPYIVPNNPEWPIKFCSAMLHTEPMGTLIEWGCILLVTSHYASPAL